MATMNLGSMNRRLSLAQMVQMSDSAAQSAISDALTTAGQAHREGQAGAERKSQERAARNRKNREDAIKNPDPEGPGQKEFESLDPARKLEEAEADLTLNEIEDDIMLLSYFAPQLFSGGA